MRRFLLVGCIVGALLVGLSAITRYYALRMLGSGQREVAAAVLQMPIRVQDLGVVEQGSIAQTTFPISNRGLRRLIVVEIDKRCCNQAGRRRRFIVAPGETQMLSVEADTTRWFGQMEETVHLRTNDPQQAHVELTLRAKVVAPSDPET